MIKVIYERILPIFKEGTKPRDTEGGEKLKRDSIETLDALYETREIVLNAFQSRIFPLKATQGTGNPGMSARVAKDSDRFSLKILTPKQM